MKIKVIDLLNKIAKGEEVPEKIKCHWEYVYTYDDTREEYAYIQNDGTRFDDDWLVCNILNNEVEIIKEDKEIEHYDMFDNFSGYSFNGTSPDLLVHLESNFEHINEELDYLIKAVNELKKGK